MSTFVRFFKRCLKNYPVRTNWSVYACFYAAAELSQQTFNKLCLAEKPDYNIPSAVRIVAVGSTLYAPTLYYWYKFLDRKFVGTAVKTVVTKVLVDQLFCTPILLACFFVLLSILEQREDIFNELREKYWKSFLANQTFWIPAQTVNFFFIPPNFRVVYVAALAFIWINVLCHIKRQCLEKEEAKL